MIFRSFLLLCSVFLLVAISRQPTPSASYDPAKKYQHFLLRSQQLNEAATAFHRQVITADSLRRAVTATRLAYKQVAWLIEYDHPGYAGKYFNGAPLLKAERTGTSASIVPPTGLQVIDETAFADAPDAEALTILCRQLFVDAEQLSHRMAERSFTPAELVAAARAATIALPTLGLTGFDTPGSLNALAEGVAGLEALEDVFGSATLFPKTAPLTRVRAHLRHGLKLLQAGPEFDEFDRLHFLREVTEPLLATLGDLAAELPSGLPAAPFPTAVNPAARSLFNDDFLDPYAFTELTAGQDNAALRQLGEQLFYDARLSAGGQLSCASCHQPELAFTDGLPKSESNKTGETVSRNSPTLVNAVYADRFFYDLRAFTLEQQAEHVLFDGAEFGTTYATILDQVNGDKNYKQQLHKALGTKTMDRDGFSAALASYVLSLRSFNSPFDRYVRGETADLPVAAKRGFNLFMGKAACGTCHFAPTFAGLVPPAYLENETEILGVLSTPHRLRKEIDADRGRAAGGIHHEAVWIYERSFKTPTVRNAALTAPYFHNGAYTTLELVVDFYDHGGGAGLGLDVPNQTLPADALELTATEKSDLVAFMESLSDPVLSSR
jgi:cytochrome c peroxidase